ncbi:MAG TPA: multiubiquitin domain-containing protein [Xanthobacteraceae bacterium]|jgi:hypothetical protein|nr:multiubiquitin domain-containing protein [Xanthobacteraceae bacterium]
MAQDDKDNPGQSGGSGNPGQGGGHDHEPDTITIIVNGRQKTVQKNAVLSYWDIVKLAFDNPQTGDGIQYTVQYTRGPNENQSGALVESQSVKVKKDMEFDVTPTNRS